MNDIAPLAVRLALERDMPFVHSSWFRNFAQATHNMGCDWDTYSLFMDRRIDALLKRSKVYVAHSTVVEDEIMGYSATQGRFLHFLYVKPVYRQMGIGRGLVRGFADYYTHRGTHWKLLESKFELKYNPFFIDEV